MITLLDNCPAAYNPTQRDRDLDGEGDSCDDDWEGDGVPNATDNCRCVANSDQTEIDGANAGFMCDPAVKEQLDGLQNDAFLIFATEQILQHPVVIPFGPCVQNCPDWLPGGTLTQVDVVLSDPRHMRVVDDRGFVVANATEISPLTYRITFEPEPTLYYVSPATSILPWIDAQALQSFELRSYTIELLADTNSDPALNVEVYVETTLGEP